MILNSCHSNKIFEDQCVLLKIAGDILTTELDIESKKNSDEFCFLFVEGRDRQILSYEDFAAFRSTKLFSEYNFPIFAFVHNTDKFLNNDYNLINKWRINIIKIPKLSNLFEYSDFVIKESFFRIPKEYKHIITFQTDGMLIKNGWEQFVLSLKVPYLGPHFRHNAGIIYNEENQWYRFNCNNINIGNGALSYRDSDVMKVISKGFSNMKLAEMGNPDLMPPLEDLFFSFFCYGLGNYNKPSLKDCDLWCQDPLTLEMYKNKVSFGGHCPKMISEWSRCSHN